MLTQYRHYKGGVYDWVCEARFEPNPEITLVIYRGQDGVIWARPRDVFFEKVEVDGKLLDRFQQIDTSPLK